MNTESSKSPKIVLSLPRSGTHFFWTRFVASGRYQLIFDADRVPALKVLSQHCSGKLDFLYPPPKNPNYNFQYNSLVETEQPMTAAEHLQWLQEKYSASGPHELFERIMALQDTAGRRLFSINRFCYTISYEWLFNNISYTIDHALDALGLLYDWMRQYDSNSSFLLVVRDVPGWIDSLFMLWGAENHPRVAQRLAEIPRLLDWCRLKEIPVFWMKDAIRAMNEGDLEFERRIVPLADKDFDRIGRSLAACREKLSTWPCPQNAIRFGRLLSYLKERDPVLRTSWVRSVGSLPLRMAKWLPLIGRRIQEDFDGLILNNAKIRSTAGSAGRR